MFNNYIWSVLWLKDMKLTLSVTVLIFFLRGGVGGKYPYESV